MWNGSPPEAQKFDYRVHKKKSVKEKLGEEFVFELKNFKKISPNWVLANWVSRKKAGNTFPKEQEQYTINWFLDGCDKPWGHDDQNCNCQ